MNSELTDTFRIIKYHYKELLNKFGLNNNKELAAFLHYNAYNEMFSELMTNDSNYCEINFRNIDTGKLSKLFVNGSICFFPVGHSVLKNVNGMKAFSISNIAKSVVINDGGLYIEKSNLKDSIVTEYYDNAALNEINRERIDIGEINNLENHIKMLGIMPDNTISATIINDEVIIRKIENYEIVIEEIIRKSKDRTLYSIYYEFMKYHNFYERTNLKNNLVLRK